MEATQKQWKDEFNKIGQMARRKIGGLQAERDELH